MSPMTTQFGIFFSYKNSVLRFLNTTNFASLNKRRIHMGLFDFVKGIGKKNTAPAEPQAAPEVAEPTAQEVANKLLGLVKSLGLPIDGLSVSYNSQTDLATVRGQVQSQADKEKIVLAIGNVDHVAQVDDQMTVASPEPESQFYTVKSGDNLSKIAKEYYGDANQYPKIFEANKPMLKDPNEIFPGQVLRIPA